MKINRLNLQDALAIVKPGLANKEILEQTTSFAFMNGRVITYNNELSISHPVKEVNFTGVVNADELYGLLQRLKKEEVNISLADSELQISCGKVKAGLKLADEIILPIADEIGTIKKWERIPAPEEFKNHLSFAMKTCSNDMSQLKLTCVNVQKNGLVQGSDGFRLVQCKGKKMPVDSFLIPATLVIEVLKIDPVEIKIKDSWVHFRNKDDTIISTRMVNDEYVPQEKIDAIIKRGKNEKTIEFPKTIDSVIDRVGQFAKRDFIFDETIYVSIEKGKLILKAEAVTSSWIEEKALIGTAEKLKFSLTPSLFIGILKETRQCILSKDITKASFISTTGNWTYVIMLRND